MSLVVRQSTAVTVVLGPFVDATDGVTAETGLTISQADVRLSKNAGAFAQANDANAAAHMENGYYSKALSTTDTNTVGSLVIAVNESGALPVWREFQVVEEAVYDRDYAASATGIVGTAQTGDSFARIGAPVGASISADVAAVKAQTAAIETDTQDIQGRLPAALVSGRIDASVGAMAANVITAAATAADFTTEVTSGLSTLTQANVRTAVGLASANLDTQLGALATQSSVDTIDSNVDAILLDTAEIGAAGAGLTALATQASVNTVDTVVDAIKAKTDSLTFTVAGSVDANITHVIADPVQTNGAGDTNWGGAP